MNKIMKSRPVGLESAMWAQPVKQGELKKKGQKGSAFPYVSFLASHALVGHLVKNWKTRWFILQSDMLFYFKKRTVRVPMLSYQRSEPAQDTEPIDFIPLEGCKIRAQPGKRYAFEIESPATGRAFLIEAATQVRIALSVGSFP